MILWHTGASVLPRRGDGADVFDSRSRDPWRDKIVEVQGYLEEERDLTRYQPPEVPVVDNSDNTRVVLLTTTELYLRHRNIERQQRRDGAVGRVSADALRGANFRISKRYRCLADPQGQVQGRMGFKYEADDLVEGTRVAVHFFHKNSEEAAADRMTSELAACLRVHRGLHASCVVDDEDLRHIVRLRDVLVCAPILDDAVYPAQPSSGDPMFRATVMVFDWNDGGDAHTFMLNRGGVDQVRAVGVFRHLLRGLRALHRRGIVHRNIKPENILLDRATGRACLCDLGSAKHVASVLPADLTNDPTSCYQSPERWLACRGASARAARNRTGVARRDESADCLYAGDVFSAGVTLLMLVAHDAIVSRMITEMWCANVEEGDEHTVPAMNVFQRGAGGAVFGLLRAELRTQEQLWSYWGAYGLRLSPALRGRVDVHVRRKNKPRRAPGAP